MSALSGLGLTIYQQKAFEALLELGVSSARIIAQKSSVPQSKIYIVLEELEGKGFVHIIYSKPKTYQAIPPRVSVGNYIDTQKETLERAKKAIPSLERIQHSSTGKSVANDIFFYTSKNLVMQAIVKKYRSAQKFVKEMVSFEYKPNVLVKEIVDAKRRGVHVSLIITKMSSKQKEIVQYLKTQEILVRHYHIPHIRIGIIDGKEAYEGIVSKENSKDKVLVDIVSDDMSSALEYYFDSIWKKAKVL